MPRTRNVGSLPSIALGLWFSAGCSSEPDPTTPGEPTGTAREAYVAPPACVAETGSYTSWMFDQNCACPAFGDKRDEQCAYELGLFACLKASGVGFSCARPPPIPVVQRYDERRFTAFYEELAIASFVGNDCAIAAEVQRCVQGVNAAKGLWGDLNSEPPVAATILPHCSPVKDGCAVKNVYSDIWDPCTTKACFE